MKNLSSRKTKGVATLSSPESDLWDDDFDMASSTPTRKLVDISNGRFGGLFRVLTVFDHLFLGLAVFGDVSCGLRRV